MDINDFTAAAALTDALFIAVFNRGEIIIINNIAAYTCCSQHFRHNGTILCRIDLNIADFIGSVNYGMPATKYARQYTLPLNR